MSTLTSIPPELLLQIISYLPTSAHFLQLSQTSRFLRTFFTTHASTICNTHITTRHSAASSILLSIHHSSGWLVPTHPCVLAEERRIFRDKILLSGCTCYECRLFLLSSRAASGSGSSLTLSEMSLSYTGGMFNCIPRTPISPAECKASSSITKTTKLTTPGPQYLVFLEKYGRDIEIRDSMRGSPYMSFSEPDIREITQEEKEKSRFDFIVGNYSVRRFLEDVERETLSLESHLENEDHDRGSEDEHETKTKRVWKVLKEKLGTKWSCMGRKKKYQAIPAEIEPPKKRQLMFGEIEKVDFEPPRESWMKGLLWYHSASETETDTSASPAGPISSSPDMWKRAKLAFRFQKAKSTAKDTTTRTKCKLRQLLRKVRCGEGFQSLDD